MKEIILSLKELLDNDVSIYYPNNDVSILFDSKGSSAPFIEKTFECQKLTFKINQPQYNINFYDCTFNCDVEFINCVLDEISFKNTKSIKSLTIKGQDNKNKSVLKAFKFHNDKEYSENDPKPKLSTNFYISDVIISDNLLFQNIEHISGKFEFIGNEIGGKGIDAITFSNSDFYNSRFSHNEFKDKARFINTSFKYDVEFLESTRAGYKHTLFYKNTFSKVTFSKSKFDRLIEFYKCDFLTTTWFEECENLDNSELRFVACEFKGFSLFDKSKINLLDIDQCTFDKSSSFTDAEFNTLKLFQVKFGGGAYFDEMKIKKVLDNSYLNKGEKIVEWKRTLRAIKQESQKIENKIDFNNYRNYELAAHYKELKLYTNFKDTSILWATKWSSNFGNWFWAFWFTIFSGLFWYSVFFFFEYYLTGNYQYYFNTNYGGIFGNGFIRFLIVTDFYNPLVEDRIYIQNFWSWIPFLFGKIFIAFGIYEMIQSFRKFKA
jgi:uncharacterized protein YjbI with pentapeptide repeats